MQNKIAQIVRAVMAGVILTACGASDGAKNGGMPDDPIFTLAPSVLPDGAVAVADRVASYRHVYHHSIKGTDTINDDIYTNTRAETQDTFSLNVGGNRTLTMTVNGVEHTFAAIPNNFDFRRVGEQNGYLTLTIPSENIFDILDGGHATTQGTYVSYSTDKGSGFFNSNQTIGYATIGIQTPMSAIESQTAVVTYTGQIDIRINQLAEVSEKSNNIIGIPSLLGTLSIDVDFAGNTVGGTATIAGYNETTQTPVAGITATFATSPIVGNGFAGTFAFDSDALNRLGLTDNLTGNYAGNFFGRDAEDLAGVLRFNGANASGAIIGVGGFRGDRQ